MIRGIQNLIPPCTGLIQERIWGTLGGTQKKIAIVVSVVFALIATYFIFQSAYRKKGINAKRADAEAGKPDADKLDAIKVLDKERVVEAPPSKIPFSIGGHGIQNYQRDSAIRLFEMLYEKQFLDADNELEIDKILNSFAQLTQRHDDGRVLVSVNDDRVGPIEENGCYFHIVNGQFSDYREIAVSVKFLKTFDRLWDENKMSLDMRKLLLQVMQEMKKAVELEKKR